MSVHFFKVQSERMCLYARPILLCYKRCRIYTRCLSASLSLSYSCSFVFSFLSICLSLSICFSSVFLSVLFCMSVFVCMPVSLSLSLPCSFQYSQRHLYSFSPFYLLSSLDLVLFDSCRFEILESTESNPLTPAHTNKHTRISVLKLHARTMFLTSLQWFQVVTDGVWRFLAPFVPSRSRQCWKPATACQNITNQSLR